MNKSKMTNSQKKGVMKQKKIRKGRTNEEVDEEEEGNQQAAGWMLISIILNSF